MNKNPEKYVEIKTTLMAQDGSGRKIPVMFKIADPDLVDSIFETLIRSGEIDTRNITNLETN